MGDNTDIYTQVMHADVLKILAKTNEETPHSPLHEFVMLARKKLPTPHPSPTLGPTRKIGYTTNSESTDNNNNNNNNNNSKEVEEEEEAIESPPSLALSINSEESLDSLIQSTHSTAGMATFLQPASSPLRPGMDSNSNLYSVGSASHNASTVTMAGVGDHTTTHNASTARIDEAAAAEQRALIYRLCRSLYKRACQRTSFAKYDGAKTDRPPATVHERNFRHVTDWMPLLHLFEPTTFFKVRNGNFTSPDDNGNIGESANYGLASSPEEASRQFLDELDVEKLTGGNSNFVYRICHPAFPNKSILIRVYGNNNMAETQNRAHNSNINGTAAAPAAGPVDAIDRYRDLTAMSEMSRLELSPAVLHTFKWGRVEEFMDNVATATTEMMLASPGLLASVFRTMRIAHDRVPVEPFLPEEVNRKKLRAIAGSAEEPTYGPDEYLAVNKERFLETFRRHHPVAAGSASEGGCSPTSTHSDDGKEAAPVSSTRRHHHHHHDARNCYYQTLPELKVLEEICPTSFERATLRFLRLTSPIVKRPYRDAYVRLISTEVLRVRRWVLRHGVPLSFSHNDLNPGNVLLSWDVVPQPFRNGHAPTDMGDEDNGSESDEVSVSAADEASLTSLAFAGRVKRTFRSSAGRRRNLVDHRGIVFIDFEYSDVNHRCSDLGNTFCELDYDYTKGTDEKGEGPGFVKPLFDTPPPTPAYAQRWGDKTEYYPRLAELMLDAWRIESGENTTATEEDYAAVMLGRSCLQALRVYFYPEDTNDISENTLARLPANRLSKSQLTESFLGMLMAHLHWSQWSFVMAINPDERTNNNADDGDGAGGGGAEGGGFARGSSGLDYIIYGQCRLREYFTLRDWLLEKGFIAQ